MERAALTGATFRDRLRIVKFLAGRGGRRVRRLLASPGRAIGKLRVRVPDRLLIAPQDIRTSDPTIAADIAAGYFAFGGKIVNALGRSPFAIEPGSEAWARQLNGFGWLRHLRAADNLSGRQRARALVDAFLEAQGRPSSDLAWEPRTTARRMLAWLSQSPVILDGADAGFYARFMRALSVHRAVLERQMARDLFGDERLLNALALAEFGLCIQGATSPQRRSSEILAVEIDRQVLADGGHISRNPQTLIDLLLDLLPLRQAYAARGIHAPQQVLNAIDRMMPMLRLFRHGDGTLALFNGMGVTAPELVATILAYDDARAQPLINARFAGYQRLESAGTLVIVDSGPPPPAAFSAQARAGCLSFELSSGLQRLVVNCGAPEGSRANAREASRTTAAHSTLVIADTSSCRFAGSTGLQRWVGEQILAGPLEVLAERRLHEDGTELALSHDGYVARFGFIHRRSLMLHADGTRLDGEDHLDRKGKRKTPAVSYVLRFHLHPAVKARATDDGASIRLDTLDGETWLFESEIAAGLEPSILFAANGGPRATTQILVTAHSGERDRIGWSFRQLSAASRRR